MKPIGEFKSSAIASPLITAALCSLLMLSGCANDQQRTRTEGAGAGAVLGAVLGGVIGGRDGALAGAALGGVAGGAYGDQQARKKQQYAQREDALKLALAQAQETTRQARVANESLQRDVAALQTSVNRLSDRRLDAKRRNELAQAAKLQMERSNSQVDQQLVAVRGEIERQQQALKRDQELAKQAPEAPQPASIRLVSAGVNDLQAQERALERAKAQLAQLDSRRAF